MATHLVAQLRPAGPWVQVSVHTSWIPRLLGHDAWTVGKTVRTRHVLISSQLLKHELVHVRQCLELGLLPYAWRYLTLLLRHGYAKHPMEQEARHAAEARNPDGSPAEAWPIWKAA